MFDALALKRNCICTAPTDMRRSDENAPALRAREYGLKQPGAFRMSYSGVPLKRFRRRGRRGYRNQFSMLRERRFQQRSPLGLRRSGIYGCRSSSLIAKPMRNGGWTAAAINFSPDDVGIACVMPQPRQEPARHSQAYLRGLGRSTADPDGGIQDRRERNQTAKPQAGKPMHSSRGHAAAFFTDGLSTELARRNLGLQIGRKTRGQPRERTLRGRARRLPVAFDHHPR
jgi:hypothetical protein